jgi:uncharacterized YccA/Bax inhibitor family protein
MPMSMQTNNPAFSDAMFGDWGVAREASTSMTVRGTANKTLILLMILTTTAAFTWTQVGNGTMNIGILLGSLVASLVSFFITVFKKEWSPVTAPLYAACEGVLLGAISNMINQRYPGIAMQAVALTFATLFFMLFLYGMRIIRVTERFKMAVVAGTGALCLVYMGSFLLSMFGVHGPSNAVFGSSLLGIGISLLAVGLASFKLLLDFDFIEQGEQAGAPKVMEWYGAFALTVTLVWLYLELLRLLRKFNDRG